MTSGPDSITGSPTNYHKRLRMLLNIDSSESLAQSLPMHSLGASSGPTSRVPCGADVDKLRQDFPTAIGQSAGQQQQRVESAKRRRNAGETNHSARVNAFVPNSDRGRHFVRQRAQKSQERMLNCSYA